MRGRALAAAVVCLVAVAHPGLGQQPDGWNYRAPDLTRPQLEQVLARYQAAATSPAYSDAVRGEAQAGADSVRARLAEGDLRPGDRIRIRVEGQAAINDTFPVLAGPAIQLPVIGRIALAGVLKSELQDRVAQSVGVVYRGVPVQVQLLTRVAVTGGVMRPGFYALPPEALIEDAIGAAGGLQANVNLTGAYIERGKDRLWQADSLQSAMRQRLTLAQLKIEPGDRIVIPVEAPRDAQRTVMTLSYLASLPLTIFGVVKLFQ